MRDTPAARRLARAAAITIHRRWGDRAISRRISRWHNDPMAVALDHVFICTEAGAPAAHRLRALGLTEGSPNHHPGQGTACRRFFFRNAMLELLWVENAAEAQGEQTRGTRLWERCSAAGRGASPFGIVIRPDPEPQRGCPFESWEYRPKTMPDLVLRIATGTELEEPMWCCIESGRAPEEALERLQPVEHPAGFREITGLRILGPPLKETFSDEGDGEPQRDFA